MPDRRAGPIRVLQIVYSLEMGGSEALARDIAIGLDGDGFEMGVCGLHGDGPIRSELRTAGVDSFVAGVKDGRWIDAARRVHRVVREFSPDVVHTHHLHELACSWPALLGMRGRLVHTEHEFYSLMRGRSTPLLRQLSRICAVVTAVNEGTAEYLRREVRIPSHRVRTLVNGIRLDRFGSSPASTGTAGDRGAPRIVVVARLEVVKGHRVLLGALPAILSAVPGATVALVGEGSERANLEALAADLDLSDKVAFLGNRQDVPAILATADIVVLPSLEEGLPLSILEAMAAAKPVVASDVGGIPGAVEHGRTGLLVPPGDSAALAQAVVSLLGDAPRRIAFGVAARSAAEGRFDFRSTLEGYRALYVECARKDDS